MPEKQLIMQRPGKSLHIMRFPAGSFPTGFPVITCEWMLKWRPSCVRTFRNGAKVVCVRFKMAPVLCAYASKWRQSCRSASFSFLHKLKLILQLRHLKVFLGLQCVVIWDCTKTRTLYLFQKESPVRVCERSCIVCSHCVLEWPCT